MPKEKRKRGPRQERKRKRAAEEEQAHAKRQRHNRGGIGGEDEFIALDDGNVDQETNAITVTPFYGLLNEEEQEYFRRADEMLELNQFSDVEERNLFLANVFEEAEGKQLKMACSQSCSRLLERLILLSSSSQLKDLYRAFSGHFLHLVQHRFASHCCETLFFQSARVVTEELTGPLEKQDAAAKGQIFVSMENLFLHTIQEFEGNLGYLVTDRYASHVLRVLLVILSGLPLSRVSHSSLLKSRKKEDITIAGIKKLQSAEDEPSQRVVPSSFTTAVDKMISGMVQGLDPNALRALATHPLGNPVLQLLVELESASPAKEQDKKNASILQGLLLDGQTGKDADTAEFVTGILFDPVGSHLLEAIVRYAPGKTFKSIYRRAIRDKMVPAATNEAASFVMIRVLERLGREDLEAAVGRILPQFPLLIERSGMAVIKSIIERYAARDLDLGPLAHAISDAYGGGGGGSSAAVLLQKMLCWDRDLPAMADETADAALHHDPARWHGSTLAQAMLAQPGEMSALIYKGLLETPEETLVRMSNDPAASRVLQASLLLPTSTDAFRRRLVATLSKHVVALALSAVGSHVADSMWAGTRGLQQHYRDRIAHELSTREPELRASSGGRAVWRNWHMDLYQRRRREWLAQCKTDHKKLDRNNEDDVVTRISGIERARQRYLAKTASAAPPVKLRRSGQRTTADA